MRLFIFTNLRRPVIEAEYNAAAVALPYDDCSDERVQSSGSQSDSGIRFIYFLYG